VFPLAGRPWPPRLLDGLNERNGKRSATDPTALTLPASVQQHPAILKTNLVTTVRRGR